MKVLALLASASAVSAHTIFQSLVVGGVNQGQGNGVRIPSYNGPIEDVSSNSMACNGNPNPTSSTSKIIDVQAGSEVTALWRYMLSTTGTAPNDVMDSTHKGPTLAYLKKVGNAATDSGVGGGWFKIQEDGFSGGVWGTEKVINGKGEHKIKIPDCIEPGQYLLRAEMIALHGAGNYPGAQFYVSEPRREPRWISLTRLCRWNAPRLTLSEALAQPSPRLSASLAPTLYVFVQPAREFWL